jgi:hypothetical protein
MQESSHCDNHDHEHHHHSSSLVNEVVYHLPYAILSVSIGLILLSVMTYFSNGKPSHEGAHQLFHSFHFMHLIFAVTGSMLTFARFSTSLIKGAVISLISSVIFCTLSDVVLPFLAGRILGVPVCLHLCFVQELPNVLAFLTIGLVNGLIMSHQAHASKLYYSGTSHFSHILVSSLASLWYLGSQGFVEWEGKMGLLYILLIFAVVVPCTMADVIVPIFFARTK